MGLSPALSAPSGAQQTDAATAAPSSVPRTPLRIYETASAAWAAVTRNGRIGPLRAGLAWDPYRHALSRFGFGPPPGAAPTGWNPDTWWAEQIELGRRAAPYAGLPGLVDALPTLAMKPSDTRQWLIANSGSQWAGTAMQHANWGTCLLQSFSGAHLYESLVDFFSNHLNVTNNSEGMESLRASSERDVGRAHAFGTFSDMLLASGRDLGMQFFLNLNLSSSQTLNENYGRELLELHTVGRTAGYTQADVVNSARIMTGRRTSADLEYQYVPDMHYVGPVQVLDFKDPNSDPAQGEALGDRYLRYLALHPATARNIATKLCVRFVSDTPSAQLVDAVAAAYLANGSAILPTVSTIFRSNEFWLSRAAKVRRLSDSIHATVRALGLTVKDIPAAGLTVQWMLGTVGQQVLACPTPAGYPDVAGPWLSASGWTSRWWCQQLLVRNNWPTAFSTFDAFTWIGSPAPATVGELVDRCAARALGTTLSADQKAIIATYTGCQMSGAVDSRAVYFVPDIVSLILHSSQFSLR